MREQGVLHPYTAEAVEDFAAALKEKLAAAQKKYGYVLNWQTTEPAELRQMLREHLEKGDPLDVAAFAMFLWARKEGTR